MLWWLCDIIAGSNHSHVLNDQIHWANSDEMQDSKPGRVSCIYAPSVLLDTMCGDIGAHRSSNFQFECSQLIVCMHLYTMQTAAVVGS